MFFSGLSGSHLRIKKKKKTRKQVKHIQIADAVIMWEVFCVGVSCSSLGSRSVLTSLASLTSSLQGNATFRIQNSLQLHHCYCIVDYTQKTRIEGRRPLDIFYVINSDAICVAKAGFHVGPQNKISLWLTLLVVTND